MIRSRLCIGLNRLRHLSGHQRRFRRQICLLAEIACGNFGGHQLRFRRQKAWFLPATPAASR
jgi:hypothetical protein